MSFTSKSLNEQLKLHTEDRDSWDNIMPMKDWTLEEYQNLYKLISAKFLVNHPEYTGAFIYMEYQEEEEEADDALRKKISDWISDHSNHENDLIDFLIDDCGCEYRRDREIHELESDSDEEGFRSMKTTTIPYIDSEEEEEEEETKKKYTFKKKSPQ